MKLSTLLSRLMGRSEPPAPTACQNSRRALIIRKLMRQGYITIREIVNMGDNSPTNTVWRMRKDGVLRADANDPKGYRMAPNASGHGEHKVYLWTKKVPAGWAKPEERRRRQRGGRS